MAVEISMNHPHFPKGTKFDVGGVLVENGGSTTLTEDQELSFVSRHRVAVRERLENSEFVKVKGSPKFTPAEVTKMFPAPVTDHPVIIPDESVEEDAKEGSDN